MQITYKQTAKQLKFTKPKFGGCKITQLKFEP